MRTYLGVNANRLIVWVGLMLVAACGNESEPPAASSGSVEGSKTTPKDAGGAGASGPSVRDDMDAAVLDSGVIDASLDAGVDGAVTDAMALPMMVNDADVRAGAGGVGGEGGIGGVGGTGGEGGISGVGGLGGEGGTGGSFPQP